VRAYLVPPASPKVPERVTSFVVAPDPTYTNTSIGLALPRGRGLGWSDVRPWPSYDAGPAVITAVASGVSFTLTTPVMPTGTAPKLMQWVRSISRWEELRVSSVVALGVNTWTVTLSSAPTNALTIASYVSPLVRGYDLLALAVERYFDSLGPGEVVAADDPRLVRAARFPDPVERYPYRAGSAILSTLQAALVGTLTSGELLAISATVPSVPADPASGPSMLVAGNIAVYPSD